MPQVSKRTLPKDREKQLLETLWEAFTQLRNKRDVQAFMDDLLTPVERIMVTKRLAIAVLLLKGWGYQSIREFLKVSNEPIARVAHLVKNNKGYKLAVDKVIRTEAGREFWRELGSLIHRLGSARDLFEDEELIRRKLGYRKKTLV